MMDCYNCELYALCKIVDEARKLREINSSYWLCDGSVNEFNRKLLELIAGNCKHFRSAVE